MGRVYLAHDEVIDRPVAVKELVLPRGMGAEEGREAVDRFRREARVAGRLSHPNIVVVHDVVEDEGLPYIVMEYLEGVTLRTLMEGGPLPLKKALEIAGAVCEALHYAHRRQVVHRDIKPENIFVLPDGRVKVTDFGIARLESSATYTALGTVLGTPGYMSPEQVRGEEVDFRADIFSLGVLLFEMLTGDNPFRAEAFSTAVYRIVNAELPPLAGYNPTFHPGLDRVIRRATAKRREDRYGDALEMREELRVCAGEARAGMPAGLGAEGMPARPFAQEMPGEGEVFRTGARAEEQGRRRYPHPGFSSSPGTLDLGGGGSADAPALSAFPGGAASVSGKGSAAHGGMPPGSGEGASWGALLGGMLPGGGLSGGEAGGVQNTVRVRRDAGDLAPFPGYPDLGYLEAEERRSRAARFAAACAAAFLVLALAAFLTVRMRRGGPQGRSPEEAGVSVGGPVEGGEPAWGLAPEPGYAVFEDPRAGIALLYPEAWERDRRLDNTVAEFYSPLESPDDAYHEFVSVSVLDAAGQPPELERYCDKVVSEIRQAVEDAEVLAVSEARLGGLRARRIEYTGRYSRYRLRWLQFIALREGKAYVFTYTAEAGSYGRFLPEAERMASSMAVR